MIFIHRKCFCEIEGLVSIEQIKPWSNMSVGFIFAHNNNLGNVDRYFPILVVHGHVIGFGIYNQSYTVINLKHFS